jgi:hypothetical protein
MRLYGVFLPLRFLPRDAAGPPGHTTSSASAVRSRYAVRKRNHFNTDELSPGEALNNAHRLAFAPFAFQAAVILRDRGILELLEQAAENGLDAESIQQSTGLSANAVMTLLEAGQGIGLLYDDSDRYFISKTGHYFRNNDTIRINTNFMRNICLPGIEALDESLVTSQPAGLRALGNWPTLFEGLTSMDPMQKESWFAFNNHHSDSAFRDALPLLFAHEPKRILDIGGSTGRFALACLDWDDSVHVGVADIYTNESNAEPGVQAAVRAGRVTFHQMNVLDVAATLPTGYDTIWMSQFMPCFSEEQIAGILAKCHQMLPDNGCMFLMETFWDRQRHAAAAVALQMTSLYFVNVATGISRMWSSEKLLEMLDAAGFEQSTQLNSIGRGHTLIALRKKAVNAI